MSVNYFIHVRNPLPLPTTKHIWDLIQSLTI